MNRRHPALILNGFVIPRLRAGPWSVAARHRAGELGARRFQLTAIRSAAWRGRGQKPRRSRRLAVEDKFVSVYTLVHGPDVAKGFRSPRIFNELGRIEPYS